MIVNMKRIKSLILKSRFIWMGIESIFKLNLGDEVIYQGHRCILYQGAYDPKWHLTIKNGRECYKYVHKNDFKKNISLRNVVWDIKHMYKFYMNYWYDIFMRVIPISKCFIVDNSNYSKYRIEK